MSNSIDYIGLATAHYNNINCLSNTQVAYLACFLGMHNCFEEKKGFTLCNIHILSDKVDEEYRVLVKEKINEYIKKDLIRLNKASRRK